MQEKFYWYEKLLVDNPVVVVISDAQILELVVVVVTVAEVVGVAAAVFRYNLVPETSGLARSSGCQKKR